MKSFRAYLMHATMIGEKVVITPMVNPFGVIEIRAEHEGDERATWNGIVDEQAASTVRYWGAAKSGNSIATGSTRVCKHSLLYVAALRLQLCQGVPRGEGRVKSLRLKPLDTVRPAHFLCTRNKCEQTLINCKSYWRTSAMAGLQTITVSASPLRMLTRQEAAAYCGLSAPKFERTCPVKSVIFDSGDRRFDVQDLDRWLDGLKDVSVSMEQDQILERLPS